MSRSLRVAIIGLLAFIFILFLVSTAAMASTVATPYLAVSAVKNFFGIGGEDLTELERFGEMEIDGRKVKDMLAEELDCTKLPADVAKEYCINPAAAEQSSPIPPEQEWLVPIWQAAAERYEIPWQLLAAVNAARTRFGAANCSAAHRPAGSGVGVGFYRQSEEQWDELQQAGKNAGHAKLVEADARCYRASAPVSAVDKPDGLASPFDAVDASFAMARQLSEEGAKGIQVWDYQGKSPTGPPRPEEPFNPYQSDLFLGAVGKAPDKVTPLADIPRNYLVLYIAAAREQGFPWEYLAVLGRNETNHGRLRLEGVSSGVNSNGCCAGPMQFSIIDTWKQPGWERLWTGNGDGQAKDYNGDGAIDVWDPRDAIPGAARSLKLRLDANGGSFTLAMASYNAGQGAVNRYGGVPPYAETQRYVRVGNERLAAFQAAAAAHPEVIERVLSGAGTGKPASKEDENEKPEGCKGALPADPVSQAVSFIERKSVRSASACYVQIVHDWYGAISAAGVAAGSGPIDIGSFPPGLKYVNAADTRLGPGPGYTMYVGCGYGSRGADVHRGRADLLALIQAVGQVWQQRHPQQPFSIGDITSPNSCHASHTTGEDVDVAFPTDLFHAYDPALAREFLSYFIMGGASMIFFIPLDNGMGDPAMNSIVQSWNNHENHSHIRIDGTRGTYPGKVLALLDPSGPGESASEKAAREAKEAAK